MIEQLQNWLSIPLLTLGDYTLRIADVASAFGILLLSALLLRVVNRASSAAAKRSGAHDQNIYIIQRVLKYIVYTVAILLAFSALGVSFDNLMLVAGALGVGIGFVLPSIFLFKSTSIFAETGGIKNFLILKQFHIKLTYLISSILIQHFQYIFWRTTNHCACSCYDYWSFN